MKFKKVFELSHDDIRSKLYAATEGVIEDGAYMWICDVYDEYFVANIYKYSDEDDSYDKYFKINYSKTDDAVTVDFDSKVEVFLSRNWEEVVPAETQQELNQKAEEIAKLEASLNTVKTEKADLEAKFNDASEKVVSLNSTVETLKPFKEKYEAELTEKQLNEAKEKYGEKFKALNAIDKFEEEEVQNLLLASISEGDEGVQATMKLNSMLVDLVEVKAEPNTSEQTSILALHSQRKDLIPADKDDFMSRYAE